MKTSGFDSDAAVLALVLASGYGPPRDAYSPFLRVAAGAPDRRMTCERVMLADISRWEEAARAHGEVFRAIRPACTFVEVKGFTH